MYDSVVTSGLDPGKLVRAVTLDRAKLVVAILTDMEIDIGRLIHSKITQTATATATRSCLLAQWLAAASAHAHLP